MNDDAERLLREGKNADAAKAFLASGHWQRACEALGLIWKWDEAIDIALANRSPSEALRLAIRSGTPAQEQRVQRALQDLELSKEEKARAAAVATTAKRWNIAATMLEELKEWTPAAAAHAEGGDFTAAARCAELAGDPGAALVHLDRAFRHQTPEIEHLLWRARLLLARGAFADAGGIAASVQHRAEDDAREMVFDVLARVFLHEGYLEAAEEAHSLSRSPRAFSELRDEHHAQNLSRVLVLGRYRTGQELGRGRSARVVRAEDVITGSTVALKLLSATSRDALERFAREAAIGLDLEHTNVVRLFAVDLDARLIVMELAAGSLEQQLRTQGPLNHDQLIALAHGLLRGIAEIHRRGVIHRDLKPSNVLLGETGVPKIADFGSAHLLESSTTVTEHGPGTIGYMAPEMLKASARPSAASDLYSIGAILRAAMIGLDSERHASEGTLNDFIQRLMHAVPELRPESATAALVELDAVARSGRSAHVAVARGPEHRDRASVNTTGARGPGLAHATHSRGRITWSVSEADQHRFRLLAAISPRACALVLDVDAIKGEVLCEWSDVDVRTHNARSTTDAQIDAASVLRLLRSARPHLLRAGMAAPRVRDVRRFPGGWLVVPPRA